MVDRPISFSAVMVSALVDGRKTQTRRILKPQPPAWCATDGKPGFSALTPRGHVEFRGHYRGDEQIEPGYGSKFIRLPCWNGDRLYVREPYYERGYWEPVAGAFTKSGKIKWRFVGDGQVRFERPDIFRKGRDPHDPGTTAWHKRLARFMPRRASRTTLIVEKVRVERLQDISEEDALAEGAYRGKASGRIADSYGAMAFGDYFHTARGWYRDLWARINGPESWEANPFVVAITVKVVPGNIDRIAA